MNEVINLLLFFFILFSILFTNKKLNKYFVLLLTLVFVMSDGLRWQMGTDWESYKDNFEFIYEKFTPGFDIGFEYYTLAIRSIIDNYSFYLLINSTLIFIVLFFFFRKLGDNYFIGFFYSFSILIWYSGSMRQLLSLSFLCFSIKYIYNRNFLFYSILILLGALFHYSMLFCLPFYFLYKIKFEIYILIFVVLILTIFLIKDYIILFENFLTILTPDKDFSDRLYGGLKTNVLLGYGRKILLYFILFLFLKKNNLIRNKKIVFLFSVSSLSIILYHFAVNYSPIVASRLDIYTGVFFSGVLIAEISKNIQNKVQKLSLFFVVIIFVLINYSRLEFMDLFHPYSGLFYNYNLNRVLY